MYVSSTDWVIPYALGAAVVIVVMFCLSCYFDWPPGDGGGCKGGS